MTRTPHYQDDAVTLYHGDCLDVLRDLPAESVHAVCTDPPYGIVFMGKKWDDHVDGKQFQAWCEQWAAECLRVLKPGGHMLAFGGTRTWHRLACAVEDAGFEVRDSIAWLYGSGFPKSLDVSKAIDRQRDDRPDVLALTSRLADLAEAAGVGRGDIDAHMGTSDMGGWWLSRLAHRCACPSVENWARLRDLIPGAQELDDEVWRLNGRKGKPGEAWDQREVVGMNANVERAARIVARSGGGDIGFGAGSLNADITAPATPDAERWNGWGTALKPAFEPIVVARKPLVGTVAGNVLAHGTGALNIDACRVAGDVPAVPQPAGVGGIYDAADSGRSGAMSTPSPAGRWPANVTLDDTQAELLDQMSGTSRDGVAVNRNRSEDNQTSWYGTRKSQTGADVGYGGEGGASRFFPTFRYGPKAPTTERPTYTRDGAGNGRVTGLGGKVRQCNVCETRAIESGAGEPSCGHGDYRWEEPTNDNPNRVAHPTVKPLDLMRWLVRLVTPPGGTVLDLFAGSGTTGEACVLEGFDCILIEREADYLPLIVQRLSKPLQPGLGIDFGDGTPA